MGLNDPQPPLIMIDWSEFLRRVWGDSTGWAFIAYAGGGQFKHRAYKYPDQLELLVNDAEELNRWANVYFCPHLFQTNAGRMKENALGGRALWVDKDGPFEELEPKPTICWQTSEGRHQALWLLDGDAPPDVLEQASKYMTYSTKSDKGGWHLGKVIRFPCSFNYKYAPPQQGLLLWDDGPVYSLEDLAPKEQVQLEEAIAKAAEHQAPKMPRKLPSVTEALIAFGQRIPTSAWELLNATPTREQDWSENLWKLERLLLEAGIPLEHTFVVVRESPWNKYKRDGRPDEHLWQEVFKASLEEGPLRDRPEDLPWVTLSELIVYSERPEWLVEGMWMDKNVGWIAGMGKSYKSVLSTDLALSVASGVPFLGKYEVKKPGPVLLVQEEDPLWRVAHRVQVMCQQKGIRMNRMSGRGRCLCHRERFKLRSPLCIRRRGVSFQRRTYPGVSGEGHRPLPPPACGDRPPVHGSGGYRRIQGRRDGRASEHGKALAQYLRLCLCHSSPLQEGNRLWQGEVIRFDGSLLLVGEQPFYKPAWRGVIHYPYRERHKRCSCGRPGVGGVLRYRRGV